MARLYEDMRDIEDCDKMKSQTKENAEYDIYLQNRYVPTGTLTTLE